MISLLVNFIPHAYAVKTDLGEFQNIGEFATALMRWGKPVIAALAVVMIIVAAYFYMTSGGNPEQIKTAKDIIIGVILGLALLYLASLLFGTIGVNIYQ